MISKNGTALIILIVEAILSSFGIEFEPGTTTKAVEGILIAMALILAVWNQIDRPDVEGFIFKK